MSLESTVTDTRLLEMRSGLFFEYPQLMRQDKRLLFFLPFWENPLIQETKEARLVEYDLINRGSTIFTHTGAQARSLNIEFALTLPHIMRSMNSVLNAQHLIESLSSEKEKDRFNNVNPFENEVKTTTAEDVIKDWKEIALNNNLARTGTPAEMHLPSELNTVYPDSYDYFDQDTGIAVNQGAITTTENLDQGTVVRNVDPNLIPTNMSQTALRAINTVVYILNIIRTCVAGNAINTVLGPPTLRLRHGASYHDVPLVCRSYDISVDQDAGYDLKTLLPYRIKVGLNTAELRAGDFGRFKPGVAVSRDNLAGWEAVLQGGGSIDPGYLKR